MNRIPANSTLLILIKCIKTVHVLFVKLKVKHGRVRNHAFWLGRFRDGRVADINASTFAVSNTRDGTMIPLRSGDVGLCVLTLVEETSVLRPGAPLFDAGNQIHTCVREGWW